jgi:hypothetical protein
VYSLASSGPGRGGDIVISAEDVQVSNLHAPPSFAISTQSHGASSGAAGDIRISTGRLSMEGDSSIFSSTQGSGPDGDVDIQATGDVVIKGPVNFQNVGYQGGIFANTFGAGPAGVLSISADRLTLRDYASL